MQMRMDLPRDFDWMKYLELNKDVAQHSQYNNRDGAIKHWLTFGFRENRPYKSNNTPLTYKDDNQVVTITNIKGNPLVLVVIPTYNAKNTILESINSVLNQTYKNIKIIIVDDCSTDNTEEIVKNIKGIIYYKLDKNVGTYNAINYGLSKHQDFDYFMIHGADDMMLNTNIEEHLKGFSGDINAVSSGFSRVDYKTKKSSSRWLSGDSMFMYSKSVFDKLGYYDNTRYGGDTEYLDRYIKCFSNNKLFNTKKILSECYLFDDKSNLTHVIPVGSQKRRTYVENYRNEHDNMKITGDYYKNYNSKLYNEDGIKIIDNSIHIKKENNTSVSDINKLKGDYKISVNLATYPKRRDSLIKVLKKLIKYDFIDIIRVYLNEYNRILKTLPTDDRIIYHIGEDNLKDSGKFYWSGDFKNEYYFTIDDDLIYSEEYFYNHLIKLKEYNNDIIITSHGKVMVEKPKLFNDIKSEYPCLKNINEDNWINNPGTGVMVFDNSKYIIPLSLFKYHGMCDLWVSVYTQKLNIPILCRKHNKEELIYLEQEDTLFDRRNELKEDHTKVLNLIDKWTLFKK